jgi:ABC-type branched-subunit amino acid transport system ATPase component
MSNVLLTVAGLGKRFGGFVALTDLELQVTEVNGWA